MKFSVSLLVLFALATQMLLVNAIEECECQYQCSRDASDCLGQCALSNPQDTMSGCLGTCRTYERSCARRCVKK
ncbi:hypothetical protein K501DRAFT_286404 [Backusella circina FSU 941]|nr:hypothetical protein K501DRAFT_286404 [Backusella circina FSU 941]